MWAQKTDETGTAGAFSPTVVNNTAFSSQVRVPIRTAFGPGWSTRFQ